MRRGEEVLFAVDDFTAELWEDDRVLRDAIEQRGVTVVPTVWGSAVTEGATIIVRSTWDYIHQPDRFKAWLNVLDDVGAVVHNPTSVLRWNMHKRYLLDLEARGVAVVPTRLIERGAAVGLDQVLAETGWEDVVIKPAISGSARLAVHAGRVGPAEAGRHFRDLVAAEDVLVQPFLPSIAARGEWSVVAIAGEPTHAVLKRPGEGDWLVQAHLGGSFARVALDEELARAARKVLAALDGVPLYARVDLARHGERLTLMELELIEPELFFARAPEAADRLADELCR